MEKLNIANQKHLTLDNRVAIETGLSGGRSLSAIASDLHKDPSTIAKEIKKHLIRQSHNTFNDPPNRCANRNKCTRTYLCGSHARCLGKPCRKCSQCNTKCPDFVPISFHCDKLDKAPYVCNGCPKRMGCRKDKAFYKAVRANKEYRAVLVEARTGINISEEDLSALDSIVSPLVLKGQSPYVILNNHPEIPLSEKTIYNYIDNGALTVKNFDLPKKVKYKIRKVHDTEIDDTGIYENRTYKDYTSFMAHYPDTSVVEMDTVLGCEGSHKVLLTFHFTCCDLMMAHLLPSRESKHVEAVFDRMEKKVSTFIFARAFSLILTDRGGEFKHPDSLECGEENTIRTSIYYCDPMASWQKPHCEKNHEYIRKICPKGTSFDNLTQKDVVLMMSHINSSPRESFGGYTPLVLARMMLPKELLDCFNLKEIPPDEVTLTPELLKGKI